MKAKKVILGLVTAMVVLMFGQAAFASSLVLDLSSNDSADMLFDGLGHFTFPTDGGYNVTVGGQHNFTGETINGLGQCSTDCLAEGLEGALGGTFTIGTVTGSAGLETATVTSSNGTFSIDDGSGHLFSGTLTFSDFTEVQAIGGLNINGDINVTNLTYTGSNADLQELLADGTSEALVVSFQFSSGTDISSLAANEATTSYSASLTAVPEPGSVLLLGSGLLGLALASRRRKLQ